MKRRSLDTSIVWFALGYVLPVVAQESPADVWARLRRAPFDQAPDVVTLAA